MFGKFLLVVPDLVFEVLSPSTAKIDAVQKKRIYECAGVREYVLVDPRRRELVVFTEERGYGDGRRVCTGEEYRSFALPGFGCPVAALFEAI